MKVIAVEPTPNPHARKFVCGDVLCPERVSFRTPDEAARHPIGKMLMSVQGVASVMLLGNFVTVVRRPDAPWPPVVTAVRRVLGSI